MAKFTVFFKDTPIKSEVFESGVIHIGRDDTNDIILDNLAVAPAHVAIAIRDQGCIIKQLNDDFPLIVNNEKTRNCNLKHGDTVTIGKYSIIFSDQETTSAPHNDNLRDKETKALDAEIESVMQHTPEANLQVMEGKHIGRIIPLKKGMTRLGHSEHGGVVVITRRKNGYFISSLDADNTLKVNGKPTGDATIQLNHNDFVVIDNIMMMFFQG